MNLSVETIEVIRQYLIKEFDSPLIIVFGSSARGVFREDSDIDVAFLSDTAVTEYQLFSTAEALAGLSGREIDLVDLKRASTVLKAQILGKGQIIYSRNTELLQNFQVRAFKEYALLNEERAEIMRAIDTRGSVYDR